jgi:methylmalonyl-CoA mutase cobalamin-binding subunit
VQGRHHRTQNAKTAAEIFRDAGFDVTTATVGVSDRESVHALAETAASIGAPGGVAVLRGVRRTENRREVLGISE